MKTNGLFKNTILLIFTLLICFFILELGVRLLVPESKRTFQFNNVLGPMRIPDINFKEKTDDFGLLTHHTNSLGFVDSEHEMEKQENVYRILFLGDSFTEAVQVPLDKTFFKALEERLNALNTDKRFEVISMGVSSYSTDHEYLVLKEFGLKYKPDLVILIFFAGNDVFYNSVTLSNEPSKPYFDFKNGKLEQIRYPQPVVHNRLVSFIINNFQSPRFFYKKIILFKNKIAGVINNSEEGDPLDQFDLYSPVYGSNWFKAWDITGALIEEIDKTSRNNGANFILVYLPNYIEVKPELWDGDSEWVSEKPSQITKEICSTVGINCLDLLPAFKEYTLASGKDLYKDHLNSSGHQLAAELIYNFLIENKIIKL